MTAPVLRDGSADYTPGISEKRGGTSSYRSGDLKSFDVQTSSTAGVSAKHTYDAFGNLDTSTGTWNGPFGYGGEYGYQSEASGLQLLGNRWYDPEVGRFLTRDPAKEGRNWYAYCENNPISQVDEDGRNWRLALRIVFMGKDIICPNPAATGNPDAGDPGSEEPPYSTTFPSEGPPETIPGGSPTPTPPEPLPIGPDGKTISLFSGAAELLEDIVALPIIIINPGSWKRMFNRSQYESDMMC